MRHYTFHNFRDFLKFHSIFNFTLYIRVLLGILGQRWENNIKMDLQDVGWGAWTELIWLRIGTGGGLL